MNLITLIFNDDNDICDMLKNEEFISYIRDGYIDVLHDVMLNELTVKIKIKDGHEQMLMANAIWDMAYFYAYYN